MSINYKLFYKYAIMLHNFDDGKDRKKKGMATKSARVRGRVIAVSVQDGGAAGTGAEKTACTAWREKGGSAC